jgi:hypothetical protein
VQSDASKAVLQAQASVSTFRVNPSLHLKT